MTDDPLTHAQLSLAIARDGALATVLRLTARLAEQQAELARLRAGLERKTIMTDPFDPAAVREMLAAYAHEAWCGWMRYVFDQATDDDDGTVLLPAWAVTRWKRQTQTSYPDLPEDEKDSDRAEADKMLADWRAAADEKPPLAFDYNIQRFGIEPQLAAILWKTLDELGW